MTSQIFSEPPPPSVALNSDKVYLQPLTGEKIIAQDLLYSRTCFKIVGGCVE